MKSENFEGSGALLFWAVVILGIWLSGWVPFRGEYTVYEINCSIDSADGKCPVGAEQPGTRVSYSPQKETESVIVRIGDDAPFKYSNCAIVDTQNWSCPGEYDAHHMIDGVLDDRTDNLGYPHFVKKWEWWWLKIKKM